MPITAPLKQLPSRLLRVFLCHSSTDKPAVRQLYQKLCTDGFDPWLDEEKILPGHQRRDEIVRAIRESEVVIVCLSQDSITKTGFVQREIKYALDIALEQPEGTIFLIPLKLQECNVPESLGKWHWVNLFEENGYERLKRALRFRAHALGEVISMPSQKSASSLSQDDVISISGRVTTSNSEPISGIEITAINSVSAIIGHTMTDRSGYYLLRLISTNRSTTLLIEDLTCAYAPTRVDNLSTMAGQEINFILFPLPPYGGKTQPP
jgi:hypothetical protein